MADFTVRGVIQIALEGNGAKDAQKAVDDISKAATGAATTLGVTTAAADALGDALENKVGGPALDEFAQKAKTDSRVVDESLEAIRAELGRLGLDSQKVGAEVAEFTAGIARSGGPIQSETVPAFQQLLAVSHDVPRSMAALQSAIATAAEQGVSLNSVMRALAHTQAGEVTQAAQALNIALTANDGTLKTQEQLLRELAVVYDYMALRAQKAGKDIAESDRVARAAAQAAQRDIAATERAANSATPTIASLRSAVTGVLGGFGVFLGIQQLVQFLKSSVTDFAFVERGINAIGAEMRALGLESEKAKPRIKEALESLATNGGAAVKESLPVFQRFLGLTKDTDAALYLTGLASNIAERGFTDMGSAALSLGGILQGRASLAAKELGIQLRDSNGVVRTATQLLQEAEKQYGSASQSFDDTAEHLDRAAARINKASRSMGEFFTKFAGDALEGGDQLADMIGKIGDNAESSDTRVRNLVAALLALSQGPAVGPAVTGYGDIATRIGGILAPTIKKPAAPIGPQREVVQDFTATSSQQEPDTGFRPSDVNKGYFETLNVAKAAEDKKRDTAERALTIERLEFELKAESEYSQRRLSKELEVLRIKHAQAIADVAGTEEEAAGQRSRIDKDYALQEEAAKTEFARKGTEARLNFEESTRERTLQLEIANAKEGTQERLGLELDALAIRRTAAIRDAKLVGAEVSAVEREYELQKAEIIERNAVQARDAAREQEEQVVRAKLAATEDGSKEQFDLEQRLLDLRLESELEKVGKNEAAITQLKLAAAFERAQKLDEFERFNARKRIDKESDALHDAADERAADLDIERELAGKNQKAIFEVERKSIEDEEALKIKESDLALKLLYIDIDAHEQDAEARILLEQQVALAKATTAAGFDDEGKSKLSAEARLAIEQEYNNRVVLAGEAADADRDRAQKSHDTKVSTAKKQTTAAFIALDKARTEFEKKNYLDAAGAAIQGLTAVFGQKKAFAVAEAVIATARAIAEASPNPYLIAAAVALGAIQIRTILKTEPGSASAPDGGAAPSAPNSGAPQQSFQGNAQTPPPTRRTGFATGGEVPGVDRGIDEVPILARPKEVILQPTVNGRTIEDRIGLGVVQNITRLTGVDRVPLVRPERSVVVNVDTGAILEAQQVTADRIVEALGESRSFTMRVVGDHDNIYIRDLTRRVQRQIILDGSRGAK